MERFECRTPEVGKVGKILVKPGDHVKAGDVLVTLEVEKENHDYKSEIDGVVKEIGCEEGKYTKRNQLLAAVEPEETEAFELKTPEVGKVGKILVKEGDRVKAGDVLVTLEVEKENHDYKSEIDGIVTRIGCEEGKYTKRSQVLAVVEPETVQDFELKTPEVGKVGKILVKKGDYVNAGDVLVTLEVEKENHDYKSEIDGIVKEIGCEEGKYTKRSQVLAVVTPAEAPVADAELLTIVAAEDGKVGKVNVKAGDHVERTTVIATVELDKGNRFYKTMKAGTIRELNVVEGGEVKKDDVIAVIALDGETAPKEVRTHAEVLIIGGGPGGYVAAIYAAKRGRKVTLVEKGSLGGTCLNVGCIPTKALVKSSEVYRTILRSEEFGILAGTPSVDMQKLLEHKNNTVNRLVTGVGYLMNKNNVTVIKGTASFLNDKEVEVTTAEGKQIITFDDAIIATGSSPAKLPVPGYDLPFVMNSTAALDLQELPETITIIGGGVIGLEFGFIYANLGVKVTIVEFLDRLLAVNDRDISEEIRRIAEEKGIRIETSARVTAFRENDDHKAVTVYEKDGKEYEAVSDYVLAATGRVPNMDGLGLDKTSIALNDRGRGIHVDEHMRTNVEHIYAIGDVNNLIQLAHAASHQGMVAVDNILGEDKTFDRRNVPSAVFTSPEVASVGFGEDELKAAGKTYTVGRFDFAGNGKAVSLHETEGYVKLIKDENNKLIGCSVIGPDASVIIAAATVAIQNGLSDEELRETIFAHPTTGEALHEAAMGLGIGTLHQ